VHEPEATLRLTDKGSGDEYETEMKTDLEGKSHRRGSRVGAKHPGITIPSQTNHPSETNSPSNSHYILPTEFPFKLLPSNTAAARAWHSPELLCVRNRLKTLVCKVEDRSADI